MTRNELKDLAQTPNLTEDVLDGLNNVDLSYFAEYLSYTPNNDGLLLKLSYHEDALVREGAMIGMQNRYGENDDITSRLFDMMADPDDYIRKEAEKFFQ